MLRFGRVLLRAVPGPVAGPGPLAGPGVGSGPPLPPAVQRQQTLADRPAAEIVEYAERVQRQEVRLSPAVMQCVEVEIDDLRRAIWREFLRRNEPLSADTDERVWARQNEEFAAVRRKWLHVQRCLESNDEAIRAVAQRKVDKALSREEVHRVDSEAFLDELERSLPREFRDYFNKLKETGLAGNVRDVDWDILENYSPDGVPLTPQAAAKAKAVIRTATEGAGPAKPKPAGKKAAKKGAKSAKADGSAGAAPPANEPLTLEAAGDWLQEALKKEFAAMKDERREDFAAVAQTLRGTEPLSLAEIEKCKGLLEWEMKEDRDFMEALASATGVQPDDFLADLTRHLALHAERPVEELEAERRKTPSQRFTDRLEREQEGLQAVLATMQARKPVD